MADSLVIQRLLKLNKPRVVLFFRGLRYEGIVVAVDENFLELYDNKRHYRKFLKISEIKDLEIREVLQ